MLQFDNTDNSIHYYDSGGNDMGTFCEGFFVQKVYSDIFSGDEAVLVKAFTKAGIKRFIIESKELTVNQLPPHLLGKGVCFINNKDISEDIVAYTIDSRNQAPVERTYRRYGWQDYCGKECYLANKLITIDKEYNTYFHKAQDKLAPAGTFETWRNGIAPFLYRPEIQLALIIGASATVVPLLKKAGIFKDTMIFALIGVSSSYKTTMLKLMASIYGKPEIGDGVIDTMMDTMGYFFEHLGKKNGFVELIDDISAASDHDFTNDLYLISMGKSRGRLTPDGKPRKVETWCTTVVYTGETSMFAQTNNNGGLHARLIELTCEWLSDKDDINSFYDTINFNYGTAIVPLVQTLFEFSDSDIRELFNEAYTIVAEKIPVKDGISQRIVTRFAILLMTLCICNKAWDFDMKIQPVLALLEETYMKNYAVIDPITLAIERLKTAILGNNHLFLRETWMKTFSQPAWGVYGKYGDRNCLWVATERMEAMAKSAGIQSFKDIQKELADRGFLIRDKSNHYRFDKTVENGIDVSCFGVYLNAKSEKPTLKPKEKKKAIVTVKSPQMTTLLSDEEEVQENENED